MTRAKTKATTVKTAKEWFVPAICLCWAWLMTQQGTPIFMARSVVAGHPLTSGAPWEWIRGLPLLSPVALPIYSTVLGDRLEKLPQPQENQKWHLVTIPQGSRDDKESLWSLPWTHELRHDGESVFWLLVWWAIHLRPGSIPSSKIDSITFGYLTNTNLETGLDPRMAFMHLLAQEILGWTRNIKDWSLYSCRWPTSSRVTCTGRNMVVLKR